MKKSTADGLRIVASQVVWGALLFGAAGRWDLPWFWAVILIQLGLLLAALPRLDPGLRQERLRPGPGGKDRGLRFVSMPFLVGQAAVAGMDAGRFGWSDVPWWLQAAGLGGFAAGLGVLVWSMVSNPFFSPVVRLQPERGHRVIASGPYAHIRHPGYAGTLFCTLGYGLALGSWWSLAILVPWWGLIIRRTVREDRFLQRELAGYAGYAARVPYRLVPGLW